MTTPTAGLRRSGNLARAGGERSVSPDGAGAPRRGGIVPRLLIVAAMLSIGGGGVAVTSAGWMVGKALIAQRLLERAWDDTRADGVAVRPWPWADIVPVARLEAPTADVVRIVLQDVSGEAMAFGPGLVAGLPGRADRGVVAIGGHRDSHLAFLENLDPGAPLVLEDRTGSRHAYRLSSKRVVDTRDGPLSVPKDRPSLVLITCWPFRPTQTGGPLRLVAVALPLT